MTVFCAIFFGKRKEQATFGTVDSSPYGSFLVHSQSQYLSSCVFWLRDIMMLFIVMDISVAHAAYFSLKKVFSLEYILDHFIVKFLYLFKTKNGSIHTSPYQKHSISLELFVRLNSVRYSKGYSRRHKISIFPYPCTRNTTLRFFLLQSIKSLRRQLEKS